MVYDFSKLPYMGMVGRVDFLQRVVLIHSILYYKLNQTIISDKMYDDICFQLLIEMNQLSKSQKALTDYWYVMQDFDSKTGFDLPDRLNEKDRVKLTGIAISLLKNEGK